MKQLDYLDRIAKREQDYARDYSEAASALEGAGESWSSMRRKLFDFKTTWIRDNPLFNETETEEIRAMIGQNIAEGFNYRDQINLYDKMQTAAEGTGSDQASVASRTLDLAQRIVQDATLELEEKANRLQGMINGGLTIPGWMVSNFSLTPKEN